MNNIKLSKEQINKIKHLEAAYARKLEGLKLECQQKIQKVLDDYKLKKARNT